ncbi:hypothetical protein [Christensenella tenuis]|uniref:Uncharacterized protein n=1 Tax=Christensenella tenuis TaxID=2763033 RepID=A0ABR7ED16_9FIRM|nr:hypothetical protein [Christensenella tenuis]MBC5647672.1 hypothetical protein [Christensenella tenuis]
MERCEKFKEYKKAMWLIIVALFFLIGFLAHAWSIAWIIFLIGAAVEQLVRVILSQDSGCEQPGTHLEERRSASLSLLWLAVVILYFGLSFMTGAWYITWIIFLIGAAVHPIVKVNIQ